MGFRSTFITTDIDGAFTQAFVEKWQNKINFGANNGLPLSARCEGKIGFSFDDLERDIQGAFSWSQILDQIVLVWLHECGGITRVEITKDSIRYSQPESWYETDGVTHEYCYGCSDVDKINNS